MSFLYVASPYTPTENESIEQRVLAVTMFVARLMSEGKAVFSPIVHSHHVADCLPDALRLDHEFWMAQDLPILEQAEKLMVLRLEGWERSRGIQKEINHAHRLGIPVEFVDP